MFNYLVVDSLHQIGFFVTTRDLVFLYRDHHVVPSRCQIELVEQPLEIVFAFRDKHSIVRVAEDGYCTFVDSEAVPCVLHLLYDSVYDEIKEKGALRESPCLILCQAVIDKDVSCGIAIQSSDDSYNSLG